jgi:hypothetical protein
VNHYKLRNLILLFTLSFSSHQILAASTQPVKCQDLFVNYWRGQKGKESKESYSFLLGAGEMGGSVWRMLNKLNHSSILEKEYYEPDSLLNDIGALKILKKLAGLNSKIEILTPLKVVKDEKLQFEDVKGFPLDKIPDLKLRKRLQQEFSQWAEAIMGKADQLALMDTHYFEDNSFWISYRVPVNERRAYKGLAVIDIMLKADNVIYDVTKKKLIIFDPY